MDTDRRGGRGGCGGVHRLAVARVFGSHPRVFDSGNADAIIQFNPKRVLYEIFGPAGTVASINYLDADAQPQRVETQPCRGPSPSSRHFPQ
jgi:Mycobacterium membrane protein